MTRRNTISRILHDAGVAAWFGGSLAGVVAINGASNDINDREDRARVASAGWARWSPVAATAIGAHLVGGGSILWANRKRVGYESGVTANTVAKLAVTAAAMGTTAYSGVLGAKVAAAGRVDADSATSPSKGTPDDVANAQQQLTILQWATPVLTAVIIGLGSQQGEQQNPTQRLRGAAKKAAKIARKKTNKAAKQASEKTKSALDSLTD